ncbi:hypothetical protein CB1_000482007 [Camelus ferus]|nr:hypothetical protein CB1_000482007 [Camelus ferus]
MNKVVHTSPTTGSNVEETVVKNTHFLTWDIGGQESLWSSWNTYYTNTEFIILVVDSIDRERLAITKEELYRMLAHERILIEFSHPKGAVFAEALFQDGYDLTIGTSERGSDVASAQVPNLRHALVMFGGLQGLEAGMDADPNLEVAEPSVLFDLCINTCPSQGSRTIHTEEAILISLATLQPSLTQAAPTTPQSGRGYPLLAAHSDGLKAAVPCDIWHKDSPEAHAVLSMGTRKLSSGIASHRRVGHHIGEEFDLPACCLQDQHLEEVDGHRHVVLADHRNARTEIYIHGLGLAINRAISIALQLHAGSFGPLKVATSTSTVELADELEPETDTREPLTDTREPLTRIRSNSAIHTRVFRVTPR